MRFRILAYTEDLSWKRLVAFVLILRGAKITILCCAAPTERAAIASAIYRVFCTIGALRKPQRLRALLRSRMPWQLPREQSRSIFNVQVYARALNLGPATSIK